MPTTAIDTAVPAGTWQLDTLHSHAGFAVKHAVVNTFRGEFKDIAATLEAGEDGSVTLTGTVQVASIAIDDPNLKGHLMAPDFFAADEFPTITFTSRSFTKTGSELVVVGDLTMKGSKQRVEGRGEIAEPTEDLYGNTRVGVSVETKIDRTAFGIDWNAPLPKGGFALANQVRLTLELAFVRA